MIAAAQQLAEVRSAPAGHPCAVALGRAIAALETARGPSRDLDAAIFAALGWEVERVRGLAWRARGPASANWCRLPNPTEDIPQAARLVPWGWAWGCGWRERIGPHAWARDERAEMVYFEKNLRSPALALTSAALCAQRELLEREERAVDARELERVVAEALAIRVVDEARSRGEAVLCACDWVGPPSALRAGRCPDCARAVEGA